METIIVDNRIFVPIDECDGIITYSDGIVNIHIPKEKTRRWQDIYIAIYDKICGIDGNIYHYCEVE